MTRPALLALVVKLAAAITDARGFHFHPAPAVLDAITDGVMADDVLGNASLTAAVVVVFAAHESGFQVNPRGSNDHGHACGMMQRWSSGEECLRLRRDPAYAVKLALVDFRRSALANPDHPFAAYAGSPTSVAAIRISDARSAEAKRLLALVSAAPEGT